MDFQPPPGGALAIEASIQQPDDSVTPEEIRWYLDGRNYFTVRSDEVDETTWTNVTDHGFILILNVAMGGGDQTALHPIAGG